MEIPRADRVRMERAHVHAWPARRTAWIDGWLWRCSGGGSQRANSVSTVDFTGNDVAAAVEAVEARYRTESAAPRFQTFDDTSPAGLSEVLRRRGYQEGEPTVTMFKRVRSQSYNVSENSFVSSIEQAHQATPDWRRVYLGEITENRRAANDLILDCIPPPCRFFAGHAAGTVVATALCVLYRQCAVLECVTTRADVRRRGAAGSVLHAAEAWAAAQAAELIGLQVSAGNAAAIRLYEKLGYQAGAVNRFWTLPAAEG